MTKDVSTDNIVSPMLSDEPVTDEELAEVLRISEHFEARKQRAAERLAATEGAYYYFALLGADFEGVDAFKFEPLARFQPVVEPPGEVELASALRNKSVFGAIGRYSHDIRFELAVRRDEADRQRGLNLAWWIISALRVRTTADILVPAFSDHSWSTIAAASEGSCFAQLLEDMPHARGVATGTSISRQDLEWVRVHLIRFAKLLQGPKFRLAVESLSTHRFATSERMMAATLWAGIEALFEVQSELRFRLAVIVASLLEPRGESRRDLYRTMKKLYDTRSKAVHGSPLERAKMTDHIVAVRKLLSRLLCQFVEIDGIPTEEHLEQAIFG